MVWFSTFRDVKQTHTQPETLSQCAQKLEDRGLWPSHDVAKAAAEDLLSSTSTLLMGDSTLENKGIYLRVICILGNRLGKSRARNKKTLAKI